MKCNVQQFDRLMLNSLENNQQNTIQEKTIMLASLHQIQIVHVRFNFLKLLNVYKMDQS